MEYGGELGCGFTQMAPPRALHVDLYAALEGVLSKHAERLPQASEEVEFLDIDEVGARLRSMLQRGREALAIIHPARTAPWLTKASQELIIAALREEVTIRALYSAESISQPASRQYLKEASDAGIEVRPCPDPPTWLAVIDNTTALVPRDPADLGRGVALLRTPGAVAVIAWAAEQSWWRAKPTPPIRLVLTAQDHQVLKSLSAGLKDDLAARQLQVSVRTYRRYVTKLCRQLGASSRFEAGAKAALEGLI
jgi:DNA-binding CsgD family transcriptional regulator